jgi:hypothetical protein
LLSDTTDIRLNFQAVSGAANPDSTFRCLKRINQKRITMQILNRIISITLSLAMFMLPLGVAQSAMIDNTQLIGSHAIDRTALLQKLDREEVRNYLSGMGVDADQVKQRVAQMTDQEVATLNQRVGELPAGGDVLGVVLLVFIVFVITDAIGATDIFPFVHPVR